MVSQKLCLFHKWYSVYFISNLDECKTKVLCSHTCFLSEIIVGSHTISFSTARFSRKNVRCERNLFTDMAVLGACVYFNAYYIRDSRPFWPDLIEIWPDQIWIWSDLNVLDTAKRPDLFSCLFARKPIMKIFIIVTLFRLYSSRLMDLA